MGGFLIRGGFSPPNLNHYVLIRRHYLFDRGVFLISGCCFFVNSGGFSNQEWGLIRFTRLHRSRATHGAIDRGPRAHTASRVAHSDVLRLQPDLESSQTSASTIRNEGRNTDFEPISRQTSRAATCTALVFGETQTCRTKSG